MIRDTTDLAIADIRDNPAAGGLGRVVLYELMMGWLVNHLKVYYMIARWIFFGRFSMMHVTSLADDHLYCFTGIPRSSTNISAIPSS